jgi:DnaJ family protein C protein 8
MKNNPEELKEFLSEVQTISTHNNRDNIMTADNQLERLFAQRFSNPYDVLLLSSEASEEEIRKQARSISILIHPDKCKDSRASDAFHMVDTAYKTLMDPEKRKIYQRIMREARERVEHDRKKENKKRVKEGKPELPEDTFEMQYREMCQKLFDEIEERKNHYQRTEESQRKRQHEEQEEKKIKEQIRQMTEEEWEKTREDRVKNWRNFASKKSVIGTRNSNHQIKAPQVKMEDRPASAPKTIEVNGNVAKPLGLNEDYKKNWK